MKIMVTGSRDWPFPDMIYTALEKLRPEGFTRNTGMVTVIEGGAKGADHLARLAAVDLGYSFITVKADWLVYGRGAGPIRNRKMLDMKPDIVLAFCLNGSRGTTDCMTEAKKRGIKVEAVEITREPEKKKTRNRW